MSSSTVDTTPRALRRSGEKQLIAHRGASAYAPEHTIAAYRLALEQKADYVEQDLQITKDGVLVCLHDESLERTTDVETVFPMRFTEERLEGKTVRRWYVWDFTLAEVKRLDAGSWFDERFKAARVPTFTEAITLVKGKAGLYPETKAPEVYGQRGFDMERLLLTELKKHGLDQPARDPRTPVIIQSFSETSLRKMKEELKTVLPLVYLAGAESRAAVASPERLRRIREFATGIGPAKTLVDAELVVRAHRLGLTVTPYTFRSKGVTNFRDVREEMQHFLYDLDVDALFTDNPDLFPHTPPSPRSRAGGRKP